MAVIEEDISASLKVTPHSIEAERSVLGGLMLSPSSWDDVSEILIPDDFYRVDHRTIYRCMGALIERQMPIDIITISEALNDIGELEKVGGIGYISEMTESTGAAVNLAAYATIVKERAMLRRLISVGNEIADSGYNTQGMDSAELIDQAETKVFQIADERPTNGGPQPISPLLTKAVERIEFLKKTKGALTGLATGFADIDEMTSGLQPADLVVIAGRPSMGKSAFAMNIAENAAISHNQPVLVFSLEMPADSLVLRMLSSLGRIDQTKIRNGQLSPEDWPRLVSTVGLLESKPILFDDTAGITPNEMRARTRRVAREKGQLGLIVIDYLQLMQVPGNAENRATEISEISRSLKGLAKEFNCPVVALSQLNRSLEQRPDKRPVMSDLRESGAIEQDADVSMAIYRDEVYREDAEQGVAEIIVLKQRNGPIGKRKLAFIGQFTRFEDLAQGYDEYGIH